MTIDQVQNDVVKFDVRGRIAIITIDRPEVRNAVNPEVARGIARAIERLEVDPDLWVGVLTGAPPVFCAGADLRAIRDGADGALSDENGFAGLVRRDRSKVLIAAVEGAALAGGMELVLACDMVVAAESALFGIPEVKRSLVANAGGVLRLPLRIPANVAMELAVTGDPISAARAYELGLVNALAPTGTAVDAAVALAERVAANPPVAVRVARSVVTDAPHLGEEEGWRRSQEAFDAARFSRDGQEGLAAFLEKRDPVWVGQ
jgi:enoyl-CoA hydratase